MKKVKSRKEKLKSQVEVDKNVKNFLGNLNVKSLDDLVILKNKILKSLEFRPYNEITKKYADSIRWKRTASEIIKDGYVYSGKACSDLVVVYIALCKAAGVEARLVKLNTINNDDSHSIVEVKLRGCWYRLDPSSRDSIPFKGALTKKSIWNKKFKVWKKGRDIWDLGIYGIEDGEKLYK